jgi:hypothetical protein
MDWLQFISSIVTAFAWPSVVIILMILLRKQLVSLAMSLEEVTLPGGAKAKFTHELEASKETAETIASSRSEVVATAADLAAEKSFLELAKNSPPAAVGEAWKRVEEVLLDVRERLPSNLHRANLNAVVSKLVEDGLIDRSAETLFRTLRQARNTAVHTRANVTTAEALEYRDQIQLLTALFRDVLQKLKSSPSP